MTLDDLIEQLQALPQAARSATVFLATDREDYDVESARYEGGEVVIEVNDDDEMQHDD